MVIQAPRKASHCPASGGGKKSSLPAAAAVRDDRFDAARHAGNEIGDEQHAADDDAHLHEVEDGHRQHAAESGVREHDGGAEEHAGVLGDRTVGDHIEDEAQCLDLRRDPAEIRGDDAQCGEDFDCPVKADAEKIAQRQDVEAVELGAVEQAGNDQAQAGAERVGNDAAHAVFHEGGGNAEHRLGAKPGGKHRGHDDGKR